MVSLLSKINIKWMCIGSCIFVKNYPLIGILDGHSYKNVSVLDFFLLQ